jgi:translation initiation factor 2 subunit 2
MEYDDALDRAIDQTPEKGSRGRFDVPDPEVRGEGNVTVYENFRQTVDRLNRDPSHLLKFLQSELGTSAEFDERGRARFTGDFRRERVATAVEEYVNSFVLCSECQSPDTRLQEEQGTTVLKCDACGALSSVPDL